MSGGSLNYVYRHVFSAAEDIELDAETPLHLAFAAHLRKVSQALHDLEWVWSYDYGPGDEVAAIRAVLGEAQGVTAEHERHADALRCALEALDYCIEDSAELLAERTRQWGSYHKDRQAAMAATLERHRAVAERLRALVGGSAHVVALYDQDALDAAVAAYRERCAKLQTVAVQVLRDMRAQGVLIEWQTLLDEALRA